MTNIEALKCSISIIKKRAEEKPGGGIKTPSGSQIAYSEIVSQLTKILEKEEKTCATCKNISFNKYGDKAQCWPKNYTSWRKPEDSCSLWRSKDERA